MFKIRKLRDILLQNVMGYDFALFYLVFFTTVIYLDNGILHL